MNDATVHYHQDLSVDQQLALRTAAVRLAREFDGTYGAETIERFLHTSYDQFASLSSVPNFLPLLAERCGDACPVFPGTRYENWDLDDPAGWDVDGVRPLRDEIERRVRRLIDQLDVPAA
jgi:protein-tyrosine-phosphatase